VQELSFGVFFFFKKTYNRKFLKKIILNPESTEEKEEITLLRSSNN